MYGGDPAEKKKKKKTKNPGFARMGKKPKPFQVLSVSELQAPSTQSE